MKLNENLNNLLYQGSTAVATANTAAGNSNTANASSIIALNHRQIPLFNFEHHMAANSNFLGTSAAVANGIYMAPTPSNLNDTLLNDLIQLQQRQQFDILIRELIQQHQLLTFQQQQQQPSTTLHMPLISFNGNNNTSSPLQLQPLVASNLLQHSHIASSAAIEQPTPLLARVEVDCSNVSNSSNLSKPAAGENQNQKNISVTDVSKTVYTIHKNKITFGRRINNSNNNNNSSNSNQQSESEPNNLNIFVEHSTLISRKHFTLELEEIDADFLAQYNSPKSAKTTNDQRPTANSNNAAANVDFDLVEEEASDGCSNNASGASRTNRMIKYWKLHCASKNGIFVNARYIQTNKWVKLLGKSYTFRFPNTNIRIGFESCLLDSEAQATITASTANNAAEKKVILFLSFGIFYSTI